MPGSYSLKAECLPLEKVWKKRLVNVCEPVTTINSRCLMMPIQQAFVKVVSDSPYQLVMNPYVDMRGLAMTMLKYDSFYDVDVSGFDLTVPKAILDAVSSVNKTITGAGQVLSNMLDSFFLTVSSTPVIAGKTLFSRQSGVPSGITCTSLIDSQCMQLIFFIACAQMYAYDLSPVEYYDSVWTYSTGDDTSMASSDPLLIGQVVANCATNYLNMESTDSTKSADVTAKCLCEISYASRRFTMLPGHTNLYTGALKKESISSALCWSETNDPVIITETVKNALNETTLHSREDYDKLCRLVATSGLEIHPQPYVDFMKELAGQVLTATSRQVSKEQTDTIFVLGNSELPRTKPKDIDLSKFRWIKFEEKISR